MIHIPGKPRPAVAPAALQPSAESSAECVQRGMSLQCTAEFISALAGAALLYLDQDTPEGATGAYSLLNLIVEQAEVVSRLGGEVELAEALRACAQVQQ